MFSKYFDSQIQKLQYYSASRNPPKARDLEYMLEKESFDLLDVAWLTHCFSDSLLCERIINEAVHRRRERWRDTLFLMPPLYVSNGDQKRGCLDHCVYCPWRRGNVPVEQLVRMCPDEVSRETTHLLSLGYSDVELVAATDPKLLAIQNATRMVAAAREAGAQNVGINFFPLKRVDDYCVLADAGCTFAIVWQETYLYEIYTKIHPRGPKADVRYRLNAHDRALQGGIKTVGVAFLGGLADWRYEALATLGHAFYLHKEYGANIIFGMPRWKGGAGIPMRTAPVFYGDKEYEFVGALYSLAIPESLVWFSTREHFNLSARCAKGGGCIFTLDCSTQVGGYTKKGGVAQFPVYSQSLNDGAQWLRNLGFNPQTVLPW